MFVRESTERRRSSVQHGGSRLRRASEQHAVVMRPARPNVGMHPGFREGELARNRFGLTAAVRLGRDASQGG